MCNLVSSHPQVDMLSQEAAIQQIQDAKSMVEEDLQHKLEEFESEREHLVKLADTATALERDLEQVKCPIRTFHNAYKHLHVVLFCCNIRQQLWSTYYFHLTVMSK